MPEIERLQRIVGWFGKRWGVRRQLESRLAEINKYGPDAR